MYKKLLFSISVLLICGSLQSQSYTPSASNLANRAQFQDMKYGMFIHWGLSSVLGDGEWVMNNKKIKVVDYQRLLRVFNPVDFNAEQWVSTAKNAGMQYIVFITRHHDSFSNWDTKYSDWKITNTPYGKDVLKLLAAECKKQGIKLGLYYSTLDWYRTDYPYKTGRTGQNTGRTEQGTYDTYFQFMKNQLTELLTNYGDIMCIWLDGHWDQTNPEGKGDRTSRIDWRYPELYNHIHQLQPACMIGNNHHLTPFDGEDFQMFERDLPGENKSGFSFQEAATHMPLESCETMNGSWGYSITDKAYKSPTKIIQLLAGAAGRNANLLLNVGPMANGLIQPEFVDTLLATGKWLQQNKASIYGTRGGPWKPAEWGTSTQHGNTIYLHILQQPKNNTLILTWQKDKKIKTVSIGITNQALTYTIQAEQITISLPPPTNTPDMVVKIELK